MVPLIRLALRRRPDVSFWNRTWMALVFQDIEQTSDQHNFPAFIFFFGGTHSRRVKVMSRFLVSRCFVNMGLTFRAFCLLSRRNIPKSCPLNQFLPTPDWICWSRSFCAPNPLKALGQKANILVRSNISII